MCEQLKNKTKLEVILPVHKNSRPKLDEAWWHKLQIPGLRPHCFSGSSVCLLPLVKDLQLTPKSQGPQAAPPRGFPGGKGQHRLAFREPKDKCPTLQPAHCRQEDSWPIRPG